MNISLSAFVPVNLVLRDGFGSPVPRQLVHLHTQAESGAYLRNSSRVPAVDWRKCLSCLLCSVGRCDSAPPPPPSPPPGLLALHHKKLDDMDCSKCYRRKKSRERNCFNCRHLCKQQTKNLCWIPLERNKKCLLACSFVKTLAFASNRCPEGWPEVPPRCLQRCQPCFHRPSLAVGPRYCRFQTPHPRYASLYHGFTHKEDGRGHRRIERRGSRQGVQPNERVRIPRGNVNYKADVSIGVDRRICNDWVSYGSTPSNCTANRAPPTRSESGC